MNLTARSAVIFLSNHIMSNIIYDLEARIRRQRKQVAIANCKKWTIQYFNGEYLKAPNLTREQIKRTKLPPTNNGQPAIIVTL